MLTAHSDITFPTPVYTEEDHGTWRILLDRYNSLIPHFMCRDYLDAFERMQFPLDRVPLLKDVDARLQLLSDWRVMRVNGIVPDDEFYGHFAAKRFPCNDFLRKRENIDYTPEPDIFHEVIGHLPMLTVPDFAAFTSKIGQFAMKVLDQCGPRGLVPVARIYWFSLEFGLIETPQGVKIIGAGFGPGEMRQALTDKVEKRPFLIDDVARFPYNYWEMQKTLFVIKDLDDLNAQFDSWAAAFDPSIDWGHNPTENSVQRTAC